MPSLEQLERLYAVVPYAQATMRRWKIPASVTLAQWIFESGWGADRIAVECNNCFGIKHLQKDTAEPYKVYQTQEYSSSNAKARMEMAPFVKYATVADSFEAHGRLIGQSARYMKAIAAPDVPSFCRALQACGYSTNPRYAKMLCDEIDALNLTQYDKLPPIPMPTRTETA